jgi:predicted DNA-binding protein (MmcQ/YjbR family)
MSGTGTKPGATNKRDADRLRALALAYPETREDHPWDPGHSAYKVRGKSFVFAYADADGFNASFKLDASRGEALEMPFAQPTGYGLGKSGWVSVQFGPKEAAPMDLLQAWVEESFRLIAPKTLVKARDAAGGAPRGTAKNIFKAAKPTRKKAAKPARKKTKA